MARRSTGAGYGSCNPSFYPSLQNGVQAFQTRRRPGDEIGWKKVLHGFKSGEDGANPNGGLVFDSKGAIYGTTQFGGFDGGDCGPGGCSMVFEASTSARG